MATTSGATVASKTGESPYRWLILFLTVLSFVLTFLCRFSWPPLIPVIVPVIHMNMSQAGAYMSAFYIGYVVTQIPAGILADAFGVRAVLGVTLAIEGIAQYCMGNITTFQTGFWLRVIIGLAAGADMSCCVRAIMEWFAPRDRGMAFGLLLAGPTLGLLIANYSGACPQCLLQLADGIPHHRYRGCHPGHSRLFADQSLGYKAEPIGLRWRSRLLQESRSGFAGYLLASA